MRNRIPLTRITIFPLIIGRYYLSKAGFRFKTKPFLPWKLIKKSPEILRDRTLLEFGSGYSTIFFSNHCEKIISCETEKAFYYYIKPMINNSNVEIELCSSKKSIENFLKNNIEKCNAILIDNLHSAMPRFEIAKLCSQYNLEGKVIILDNSDNPQNFRIREIFGKPDEVITDYGNMGLNVTQSSV